MAVLLECGLDFEMAGRTRPTAVAPLAFTAAAGAAMATVAMATVHHDCDVGVVLVVLDKATIGIFTQLFRDDTVNHVASI